jgi:hypothetical protein
MTDDAPERRRLMAESAELMTQVRALRDADRGKEAFPLRERIHDINQRYRDLLPEVTVARCPTTGELVRWPIETMGLDAWFWDYRRTIRRDPDVLPPSWLAMTGAMRLTEPVERTEFVVVPGPDAPFVVPRILKSPGVRAVIAQFPVGTHLGWTITYFGPQPPDVELVNLWGANSYPVFRNGEWTGRDTEHPKASRYDFKLTRWLRSGALLWLKPGDGSATLREGPDGCPFVDLPGSRRISVVANGVLHRVKTVETD